MPDDTSSGSRSRPGFFARLKERLSIGQSAPPAAPALPAADTRAATQASDPAVAAPVAPPPRAARFRLGAALDWLAGRKLTDSLAEELEMHLLEADVGLQAAEDIIGRVRKLSQGRDVGSVADARALLREAVTGLLRPRAQPLLIPAATRPFVILMVGVNGAGKTTTIGKLARRFRDDGLKVMLAAGDTYRAAAIEQLQVWGERNGVPVIAQQPGADPAAVIYDALEAARARGIDVLLADTAGRLQNKAHLMRELQKIVRVLRRLDPAAPHETMIVLDASLGQNAVSQARQFHEAIGLTGITMTKLDAGGKGGVLLALASQLAVPVRFIGIGEQAGDMDVFDAAEFAAALIAPPETDGAAG